LAGGEKNMHKILAAAAVLLAGAAGSATAQTQPLRPDQVEFRALYKELVETNTSASSGSCTLAAERMAARLKAAGIPSSDIHPFAAPDRPKEGGVVVIYPGRDPKAKAVLMLAHIDVVEAKREDWTRDPFTLVEENGYFYARGAIDDKLEASIWVDTLIRFKKEGFKPRRTVKMALTCGEEGGSPFDGAEYLAKNKRDLIDAAFAVNEGGYGQLDASGKPMFLAIQVGEKLAQNYTLEVTNPGGHSSRPMPDNAIYHLANALVRIQGYSFPITFNDTTRSFFGRMAERAPPEQKAAIAALIKDPQDRAAEAILVRNPDYNAILHTNCVATMLDAGHASNALPQRARATINCRIFPGTSVEQVRQTLEQVVGDAKVKVSVREVRSNGAPVVPLDPKVLEPAEKLATEMWPGVPQLRMMLAGATDGAFLTPAGIPTYGIMGIFSDPDGDGVHGLNERVRTKVLYDGRDYLYRLMKVYGDQAD
jgi:acetylornithine deacetylase/succinyl-diaminopimelate desuccinylase-like protein